MMKKIITAAVMLLTGNTIYAQPQEVNQKPATWNSKNEVVMRDAAKKLFEGK